MSLDLSQFVVAAARRNTGPETEVSNRLQPRRPVHNVIRQWSSETSPGPSSLRAHSRASAKVAPLNRSRLIWSALRRTEAQSSGMRRCSLGVNGCRVNMGLLALPRFAAMGEQHQVHVWENTYIMAPKASTIPCRPSPSHASGNVPEARMTRRCCRRKSRQSSRTSWKATCRTPQGGTRAGALAG